MPDIKIRDNVYSSVPAVKVPINNGGGEEAYFYDTSDATLNDGAKMAASVTAYSNGVKYTGTATERTASDLSASGDTVTTPAGIYYTQATKAVAAGSSTAPATISGSAASVSTGTNTLTLSKTVSVTPSVTAGYVSSGTAGNSAVSLTANVTTKAAANLQPSTSAVTIAAGTYCTGAQTIPAEPNYVASNIAVGKSLWGLNGSLQVPVVTQDSTTHILSIS